MREASISPKAKDIDVNRIHLEYDIENDMYTLKAFEPLHLANQSLLYKARAKGRRRIRLAICITMYNEGPKEFFKTMRGVYRAFYELMRDIGYFNEEIIVILIADGFEFLNPEFLKMAEGLFYVESKMKDFVDNKNGYIVSKELSECSTIGLNRDNTERMYTKNFLHCFQSMLSPADMLPDGSDRIDIRNVAGKELTEKMTFFFGAKHKNAGKIDSHMWFFRGFCTFYNPDFCLMLDVGTEPLGLSVTNLMAAMEINKDIGGCCGEIEVEFTRDSSMCEHPGTFFLVAAQYLEYKIAHYLDKSFESLFGFVSVLPGAFSAFRWKAIQEEPLDRFFKGRNRSEHSCFEANMFLAEDRIMCLELLVKPRNRYILKFLPNSKAVTDPPLELTSLIKQRRRWINGSTFATFHFLQNFSRIKNTKHNFFRKVALCLFFFHYLLTTLISSVIVGTFFSAFSIFIRAFLIQLAKYSVTTYRPEVDAYQYYWIAELLEGIYLGSLCILVILSLTSKPERAKRLYLLVMWVLGALMLFTIVSTIMQMFNKEIDVSGITIYIFMIAYLGSYVVPLLMGVILRWSKLPTYLVGMLCYLIMTPTYVHTFVIFAFCNIHDVSWGNRQTIEDPKEKKLREDLEDDYKSYRKNVVIGWLAFNFAVGYGLTYISRLYNEPDRVVSPLFPAQYSGEVLIYLAAVTSGLLLIKVVGAILYKAIRLCNTPCRRNKYKKLKKESAQRKSAYASIANFSLLSGEILPRGSRNPTQKSNRTPGHFEEIKEDNSEHSIMIEEETAANFDTPIIMVNGQLKMSGIANDELKDSLLSPVHYKR